MSPVVQARVPPVDEVSEKFLTFKMAFLLAIVPLKRVGDLQALSVSPCLLLTGSKPFSSVGQVPVYELL